MRTIWNNALKDENESYVETLSSWKTWAKLLRELIETHWQEKILDFRRQSLTPKEIEKILEQK